MIRLCAWCVPSHVIGVKCDKCGSENCVAAVKRPYWLCVDCGAYFENDVITHGMCNGARLAFLDDATESLVASTEDENGPRMIRTALALALVVAAMAALVLWGWL